MRQLREPENTMQKTSFRKHRVERFSTQQVTRQRKERQLKTVILFNKPYDVLPQFTDEAGRRTLKDFIRWRLRCRSPRSRQRRPAGADQRRRATGKADPARQAHRQDLFPCSGGRQTHARGADRCATASRLTMDPPLPAGVELVDEPVWLWPRNPPIRERKSIPTRWLKITLYEGRNRQVRRMTAHVGFPTLRLIRFAAQGLYA